MLPPYKESKESFISEESIIKEILDTYEKLGLDYVIWRNDSPYPNGTKLTLNDLSNDSINFQIKVYSEYKTDINDVYVLIFKDAVLKKRIQKIKKLKDRIDNGKI